MVVGGGAPLLGFCVCVGLLLLGFLDCCVCFIWNCVCCGCFVWYIRDVDVDVDVDVDWKYLEDANVCAGLFIRVEKEGGGGTMGNGDIGIVCFFSWLREGERKKEREEREREREGIVSYNPPCPSVDSRYFLCVKGSLFSQSKAIVCMCAFAVFVWTRAENARSSLHRFRRFSFPCCRKAFLRPAVLLPLLLTAWRNGVAKDSPIEDTE